MSGRKTRKLSLLVSNNFGDKYILRAYSKCNTIQYLTIRSAAAEVLGASLEEKKLLVNTDGSGMLANFQKKTKRQIQLLYPGVTISNYEEES